MPVIDRKKRDDSQISSGANNPSTNLISEGRIHALYIYIIELRALQYADEHEQSYPLIEDFETEIALLNNNFEQNFQILADKVEDLGNKKLGMVS